MKKSKIFKWGENMSQKNQDLEAIRQTFTKSLIEAISSKSVEAYTKLVMSYEDYEKLQSISLDISKETYQAAVLTQSEQLFEKKNQFIDERNAHADSALSLDNLAMVVDTSLPVSNDYEFLQHMGFIRPFTIKMKQRLIDDIFYEVFFDIKLAFLVDGEIKLHHDHEDADAVFFAENNWDDINEKNTPYLLLEDKKVLRKILEKHAKKEYIEVLDYFHSWYVHEGDLILENYDIKVNLIVTGNLTIQEPIAEITNELIVLGNTNVNALYLSEEGNNTLFLGGIEFKVAIFISFSGAYQVLNNPRGSLIYASSETVLIDTAEQVQCTYAPDEGFEDDYSKILLAKFLTKYEDGFSEIDLDAVLEAIRAGETIFKN